MTRFTKTFIHCDFCEAEGGLSSSTEVEWLQIQTEVLRLTDNGEAGETLAGRQVDLCPQCYAAVQDSEFSSLFEQEIAVTVEEAVTAATVEGQPDEPSPQISQSAERDAVNES